MTESLAAHAAPTRRGVVAIALVTRTLAWSALWLVAWLVVPLLATSWQPMVITSGSMTPLLRPGDVVFVDPSAVEVARGDVVTFRHPTRPEVLVTHRTEQRLADGRWITRGDANRSADSTPVERGDVVGVARLLVPWVGMPLHWLTSTEAAFTDQSQNPSSSWAAASVAPPTSLAAESSCILGSRWIDLTWVPSTSSLATRQHVERATSATGPFEWVDTLYPSTKSWGEGWLPSNTTYYYRVVTRTASTWSATSATAWATTPGSWCI